MMLYFRHGDKYTPIARVKEIKMDDEPTVHIGDLVSIPRQETFTIKLKLNRKDKRLWGKVFMMPRWKVTEWAFPQKKKRATRRRKKHE